MSSRWRAQYMSWNAFSIMLSSLVIGIALAAGHHFFYHSLNDTPVDGASFDQQVNTAIGTAFAFLVRASLVLAIGVAYHQVFWRTVRSRSLSISNIDTLASLLTTLQEFLNVKALYKHPLIVLLALLSWIVPFALIVPPATLSVHTSASLWPYYTTQYLPTIDFNNSAFSSLTQFGAAGSMSASAGGYTMRYNGPSSALLRLTIAATTQGSIAPIPSPAINSSYSINLFAPSLQCTDTSTAILDKFTSVFGCSVKAGMANNAGCGSLLYHYLSWTPSQSSLVPFDNSSIGPNGQLTFVTVAEYQGENSSFVGSYGNEPLTLFLATRSMKDVYADPAPWSVLNCSLYNSSLQVNFNYSNGLQQLQVVSREYLNAISMAMDVYGYNSFSGQDWSGKNFSKGYYSITPQPQISYQAVMEALGKIIVGVISGFSGDSVDATFTDVTSVMSTDLAYSKELSGGGISPLHGSNWSLATATEELFFNITMSLLGNNQFLNLSNSTLTPVTIFRTYNIYKYTWSRLVLAYGLAIIATLVATMIGHTALAANSASFSNKFSTILRTTRGTEIDSLVSLSARDGADPLPKELGISKIRLGQASTSQVELQLEDWAVSTTSLRRKNIHSAERSVMISDDEGEELGDGMR